MSLGGLWPLAALLTNDTEAAPEKPAKRQLELGDGPVGTLEDQVAAKLREAHAAGDEWVSAQAIVIDGVTSQEKRAAIARLVDAERVQRQGEGRGTAYRLKEPPAGDRRRST